MEPEIKLKTENFNTSITLAVNTIATPYVINSAKPKYVSKFL